MDNLPSNSHGAKRDEIVASVDDKAEPKKIETVVTGNVVRRKKPLGKRFKELFIGGDTSSVGQYVLFEVIMPAVKDTISDVVTQAVERTLYGNGAPTRGGRRGAARPTGANGYVSYNRFSQNTPPSRREDPRDRVSRQARASHDFDEIVLDTRKEAEEVVDGLFNIISRYEQVTVADLYELCGISSAYTDQKWGWTDVRGAGITRVRNGYLLDLPKPEQLD